MSGPPLDSKAELLLKDLLYGSQTALTPRIATWISYPAAQRSSGLDREAALNLILSLWQEGYLDRSFFGMAHKCPLDGTTSLRPKMTCPTCGGEENERTQLIEHLECGHVDREENFIKGSEYVCPIDNKKLKLIGVDYRKTGLAHYCPTCNELFPEPNVECVCNYANHVFSLHESVQEKLYTYTLNEDRKSHIIKSDEYIQPLTEVFLRSGYNVKTYHPVMGDSGVSHLIEIYAEKSMNETETVIVSILDGQAEINDIIKHYATSLDIGPTKSLLISIPGFDESIRVYASKLDLEVLEGESISVVSEKLSTFIG